MQKYRCNLQPVFYYYNLMFDSIEGYNIGRYCL